MTGAARHPSAGISLVVRFEKLKFIVSELQLGLHFARHAPDDFAARTFAKAQTTDDFMVKEPMMLNALKAGEKIRFTAEQANGELLISSIRPPN